MDMCGREKEGRIGHLHMDMCERAPLGHVNERERGEERAPGGGCGRGSPRARSAASAAPDAPAHRYAAAGSAASGRRATDPAAQTQR